MIRPGKIKMINTGLINPSTSFIRSDNDNEDMKLLVKSIMKNDIIQPLIVKKIDKNKYEVICGNRRLYAAKLLALDTVPCIIKDIGRHKCAVYSVCDNLIRHDLTFFEQAQYISSIIEEYKFTVPEASQKLCMSPSQINKKLELLSFESSQKIKIERLGLNEYQAIQILRLPESKRNEAIEQIAVENLNDNETLEYVNNLLSPSAAKVNKLIVSDLRLFSNSIDKALSVMKTAGINARCEKDDTEEDIKYIITIPKRSDKVL